MPEGVIVSWVRYGLDEETEDKIDQAVDLLEEQGWIGTDYSLKIGLVDGFFEELGYFTLSELESVQGPFGLGIERDKHFKPKPLSEVWDRWPFE